MHYGKLNKTFFIIHCCAHESFSSPVYWNWRFIPAPVGQTAGGQFTGLTQTDSSFTFTFTSEGNVFLYWEMATDDHLNVKGFVTERILPLGGSDWKLNKLNTDQIIGFHWCPSLLCVWGQVSVEHITQKWFLDILFTPYKSWSFYEAPGLLKLSPSHTYTQSSQVSAGKVTLFRPHSETSDVSSGVKNTKLTHCTDMFFSYSSVPRLCVTKHRLR